MPWIALAVLSFCALELFLLVKLGAVIGAGTTIWLVLVAAVLGAMLAKREGLRVLGEWQQALAEMRVPAEGLGSGLLVLLGGALLMLPGVVSDVLGLLLMIPPVRRAVAGKLETMVRSRVEAGGGPVSMFDFRYASPRGVYVHRRVVDAQGVVVETRDLHTRREPAGNVIEAEVIDSTEGPPRRLGSGE